MSQPNPDWQQAEAAYTRAIEFRDLHAGDEILRDLRESVKAPRSQQLVTGLHDVKEWLRLNDVREFEKVDGSESVD
jgi:hypothetical protein